MTRRWPAVLAAVCAAAGAWWQLNQKLSRHHADRMEQAAAQRRMAEHFTAAHPLVPVSEVPAQAEDVHDLDGLRRIGLAFGNGR